MEKHTLLLIFFVLKTTTSMIEPFQPSKTIISKSLIKDTLIFSFNSTICVNIQTKFEQLGNYYYKAIFQSGISITLKEFDICEGHILFIDKAENLIKKLDTFYRSYDHRTVCFILNYDRNIDRFLQSNYRFFESYEFLIVNFNTSYVLKSRTHMFRQIDIDESTPEWGEYIHINNFMGKEFTIATFNSSAFSIFGPLDKNGRPSWFKGSELLTFAEIADHINITWRIRMPDNERIKWGSKKPDGSWSGGIFGLLYTNKADLAFGCIWMTPEKFESFALPSPWDQVFVQYLIRRPQVKKTDWRAILRPLPRDVWILLLVSMASISIIISLITRLKNWLDKNYSYKRYQSFWMSSFLSLSILLNTHTPRSDVKQGPLRYIIVSWVFTSFLFVTVFCSSLVSHLTTTDLEYRPETIKEFVERGYYWGAMYAPNLSLVLDLENPWHKAWLKKFIFLNTREEHIRVFHDPKFVLWGKSIGKKGFVLNEDYFPQEELAKWELSSELVNTYYYTFALRSNSPLIPVVNRYSSLLLETGIIQRFLAEQFWQTDNYMREVFVKTKPRSAKETAITLNNLRGVLFIYVVGLTIASITFVVELCLRNH